MSDFADKARSIGTFRKRGQSEKKIVLDERNGSVAGHHVEHWDGHQDAVVKAKTVRMKVIQEGQ